MQDRLLFESSNITTCMVRIIKWMKKLPEM